MTLSRRHLLAAAALLPAAPALAKAPLAGAQTPAIYRYKVGDVEVTAIGDGLAMRPIEGFIRNADLAEVKQVLADSFLPTDAVPISFTTLVINNGSTLTLVDAGNGQFAAPTSGTWMANFRAAGFDPKDVDTVVYSHFHGDHINGTRGRDGAATFPNAELRVPAPEWAYWMDDAKMAAAPEGLKPGFAGVRRVFGPVANNVTRYEWGKEAAPGLTAIEAPGHTPGHTAFALTSAGKTLLIMSDTTNHPALFVRRPDWTAVFDMDGPQAITTRKRMLDMAITEKAQVAFYHAPFPATGHIQRDGSGYRLAPLAWAPV
jgi:glyoxylase-like metal-dependent hydrolase (beta-lactamase superfamily II)